MKPLLVVESSTEDSTDESIISETTNTIMSDGQLINNKESKHEIGNEADDADILRLAETKGLTIANTRKPSKRECYSTRSDVEALQQRRPPIHVHRTNLSRVKR